jgi:hypothetical protein
LKKRKWEKAAVTLFGNEGKKIVKIVFLLKVVYIQRKRERNAGKWNENKFDPLRGCAVVVEL